MMASNNVKSSAELLHQLFEILKKASALKDGKGRALKCVIGELMGRLNDLSE